MKGFHNSGVTHVFLHNLSVVGMAEEKLQVQISKAKVGSNDELL
jgi:hypothetical protein